MSVQLEPTGERMIEDAYHRSFASYVIYLMHAASYRFVESSCADKQVIDLGCGSGYGAARIAKVAARVEGVDISDEAVAFARARYSAGNLRYSQISANGPLPFDDGIFDVALSFQVIEHVEDDISYLREAWRVLKPGGTIVVITPDRRYRLLPGQKPWNRWHLREYSASSLTHVVESVFDVEKVLRMGAPWQVAGVEHRRYRWLKWLTLPVTTPFMPEKMRRLALDLIHALRHRPIPVNAQALEGHTPFEFDERDLVISEEVPNSLNLVLIARKTEGVR